MDRTEELRAISTKQTVTGTGHKEKEIPRTIEISKDLKCSLSEYNKIISRCTSSEYIETEKNIRETISQIKDVIELLEGISTEANSLFIEGIIYSLKLTVSQSQTKLESKRYKERKSTLNIALEPEKAPSTIKTAPVMMHMLQEENELMLKRIQYTEREIIQVRRKLSEIDVLQKLIAQELFSQDERIDVILEKTHTSTMDVKISRTYLKNAGEKRKSLRRFVSILVLIFSLMILLLHSTK
ncbi:hypothetical protein NEOKW01_1479 [Nematocida sp. AWRm80]|nr:hypothetical protein NEOKW01_1479 [Nematocida sp. AWRm80]